jgi:hypothetical protein
MILAEVGYFLYALDIYIVSLSNLLTLSVPDSIEVSSENTMSITNGS